MRPWLYEWRDALRSPDGPKEPTRRFVLLALSLHADREGESCYPSSRKLASETGLHRKTVMEHLAAAEAEGWIRREERGTGGRGWRRHGYTLEIPDRATSKVVTESDHADEVVTQGDHPTDSRWSLSPPEVVTQGDLSSSGEGGRAAKEEEIEVGKETTHARAYACQGGCGRVFPRPTTCYTCRKAATAWEGVPA